MPSHWTAIRRLAYADDAATVRLSDTGASRLLDHLLCSMVQNAEVYFHLCNTPAWIRARLHAWVRPFERLRFVKSKIISRINYWLAGTLLGISIRYGEYEPIWARNVDMEERLPRISVACAKSAPPRSFRDEHHTT
ncbi:uncharacterized protein CC84DRAFT_1174601 [Paraphaeosphaeria sporulosa]|uniref:Uncharacterized protein n=1 Tax=Paraphaeosphaeria sporulosa TaxID=1460663 RepID=A0A177CIJ5_9PLEO|nr:uncharacterized protein CC84DRAFT_1174601 [Paraphaeosphaeria sporulosa]OAG06650.1 hypothetical protein CC84DRAFT_1174601 [Paraphaeosphaeria sporulosa]